MLHPVWFTFDHSSSSWLFFSKKLLLKFIHVMDGGEMLTWVDCPTSLLSWTFPFCRSQAKKDGAEDDIAKYDGAWAVEPLAKVTPRSLLAPAGALVFTPIY